MNATLALLTFLCSEKMFVFSNDREKTLWNLFQVICKLIPHKIFAAECRPWWQCVYAYVVNNFDQIFSWNIHINENLNRALM